jgi:PAS domain S-box-containing protein
MTGILLVGSIPLAATAFRRAQLRNEMLEELNALGRSECAKVAKNVYLMLQAQHEKSKREFQYNLNVGRYVMKEAGPVSFSSDRVHWKATNQFSGKSTNVELPKMLVGKEWLGQNANRAAESPIVDTVRELVGGRCTIFQRMNESGDLLRVCTNVLGNDGRRAIGTYIPAKEPNGTPNAVVAAILKGETYIGRAYVVNAWFLTGYEPLFDANHQVVGALFCGVRLENIPEIRKGIMDITVGRTGYAYVLEGSGPQKGRYIVSYKGLRDGENIYDSQDAGGNYFIRDIIDNAVKTKNGECYFTTYEWRNLGETHPRPKVAGATYFEPWDWVIGAGTYQDDFQDAIARIDAAATRLMHWGTIGVLMAFVLCGLLAWIESGRIAAMNHEIAERKSAEKKQERMALRLDKLNQLQRDLLLPASLEDKLRQASQCAFELFELDFCRIWEVQPGDLCEAGCIHATAAPGPDVCPRRDLCLHLMASVGRYTHVDGDHHRVPLGCYKIGRIASGEENSFVTNEVSIDPQVHDREWAKRLGLVSFAGYKLRDNRGNPIGVFAMFAKHPLSEEDNAFLLNMAETISSVMVESRAEERIRNSEAKYKALYDSSGDAIMYCSPEGKMFAGNPATIRMFRCKDEAEFIARYVWEISPECQPDGISSSVKAKEMLAIALEKGSNFFEWQYHRVNGEEFPATVLLNRIDLGGTLLVLATVHDITAQKKAEQAQRESERRLANIIDFLPDATFVIDCEGVVIAWNRAMEEMTGVLAANILGKGDHEYARALYGHVRPVLVDFIVDKNSSLQPDEHYRALVRKGAQLVAESFTEKLRGGTGAHVWAVAAPLYDSNGCLVGSIESIRDITDRRRDEIALRASETQYKTLYNALLDGIMIRTPERFIVAANPAAVAMFGYNDEREMLALSPEDLSLEYQSDGMLSEEKARKITESLASETGTVFEWTYKRKDGTTFDATVALTRMNLEDRYFHLITIRDITEQKRAEEAVRASEKKFRTLYDSAVDAIMLRRPNRQIIAGNPAAIALFGCTDEQELISLSPDDLYPVYQPDGSRSAERIEEIVENALRNGLHMIEWRYRRRDGTEFDAVVSMERMRLESEDVGLITIRDVTKQKEAERALRASETKYRVLADNVSDVIWVIDFSGSFTYGSPSVEQLLGYTPAEFVSLTIDDVLTPAAAAIARDRIEEAITAAERGERVRGKLIELEQVRKDGSVVLADASYCGIYDDSGKMTAIQGITRDATERKMAEKRLAQALDEAQAANRAKSVFLATMSHEIRTPMTAILGYADLLLDPNLSQSTRNNYAATIHRSGEHLLALINDILDLSKIEAGKMTLDMGRCNVVVLLGDIASMFRPRARQRGILFELEFAGPLPETIETDVARLRQAIVNLVGNAIKFTEKGSVRIVASLEPATDEDRAMFCIRVVDTGIGIRAEVLPELFQAFHQGDVEVSRRYGGTGLGLAISHHIAELLGGDLTVESDVGRGSTFTLTIPVGTLAGVPILQRPSEMLQEVAELAWTSEPENLRGVKILLAEDGIDNRELIEAVLQRVGADIEMVENGRLAVEKASRETYDLILMDMNMPEMDGYEATSILRDRGYSAPIIALTANAMVGDNARCQAAGCDGYLTKPIDRKVFLSTIASFVKRGFAESVRSAEDVRTLDGQNH